MKTCVFDCLMEHDGITYFGIFNVSFKQIQIEHCAKGMESEIRSTMTSNLLKISVIIFLSNSNTFVRLYFLILSHTYLIFRNVIVHTSPTPWTIYSLHKELWYLQYFLIKYEQLKTHHRKNAIFRSFPKSSFLKNNRCTISINQDKTMFHIPQLNQMHACGLTAFFSIFAQCLIYYLNKKPVRVSPCSGIILTFVYFK